jgi:hypothetical protein
MAGEILKVTDTVSEGFNALRVAIGQVAEAKRVKGEVQDQFVEELRANIGKSIDIKGFPSGHVSVFTNERVNDKGEKYDKKSGVHVPCYSLLDGEERKPREYIDLKIVDIYTDAAETPGGIPAIAVSGDDWGEDYEIFPLDNIIEFSWCSDVWQS